MNEIFYDYVDYWKHEGKLSKIDSLAFRLNKDHEAQEAPLIEAFIEINPDSVLEIGAGWGRICKLLKGQVICENYTAMDISYDRLKMILDKSVGRIVGDFYTHNELLHYDLVLAIELLMHIPPDIIDRFVQKMKDHGKTIIILDYDPEQPRDIELADHNFLHDYDKLFDGATVTQVNYVQKMRVWKK